MNRCPVSTTGRINNRGLVCTRLSTPSTSVLSHGRRLRGPHVLGEYPVLNPGIKGIGRGTWTQYPWPHDASSLVVPDTALAAEACT